MPGSIGTLMLDNPVQSFGDGRFRRCGAAVFLQHLGPKFELAARQSAGEFRDLGSDFHRHLIRWRRRSCSGFAFWTAAVRGQSRQEPAALPSSAQRTEPPDSRCPARWPAKHRAMRPSPVPNWQRRAERPDYANSPACCLFQESMGRTEALAPAPWNVTVASSTGGWPIGAGSDR